MLSLSIKEMKFFKLKYLLVAFILFFTASLVFIINGLANGLSLDNASSIKNMNADHFYMKTDAEKRLDRSKISETEALQAQSKQGLEPLGVQMFSLKEKAHDQTIDLTFMGIQADGELHPKVVEGQTLKKVDALSIVADESLKEEGVKLGDKLYEETSGLTFTIAGFTSGQTYSHTPVAFINLKSWTALTERNNKVYYNALVATTKEQATGTPVKDGQWLPKDEVMKSIPGFEAEQSSLYMMLGFLLVITVFILTAFFYIITGQKMNQFGILKAIGSRNSFLIGTTIIQAFLLSIISIGIAAGFAIFMATLLPEGIPYVIDTENTMMLAGVLLAVALVGSLISSFNIVQADPIEAMGRVE
ncbi:ABC transporter permease [Bacillus sp. REN10]|uniref:ABC transporter permease n=1 Tax=Bacillus sp. REN10 TaxID=2782541 RepID=UPI00193B6CD4|nr:ABC transporter permease [Bacillus sp. REN10]